MSPVEVIGRDVAREAYRVRVDADGHARTAFVPECLMETLRPGERPSPPYDLVTLAEES